LLIIEKKRGFQTRNRHSFSEQQAGRAKNIYKVTLQRKKEENQTHRDQIILFNSNIAIF
jgi:hypothetical protein